MTRDEIVEAGLGQFPWWKDWRGRPVMIVASGPSTKKSGVDQARGRLPVVVIKENVDLCPWADVAYGCDAAFWKNRRGLADFLGVKVSYANDLPAIYPDIRVISIDKKVDQFLFDKPGRLGSGGNSGFQALNLALQFGSERIVLVGFDMTDRGGVHWYGRNTGVGRSNPSEVNFKRWRAAFAVSAPDLVARGIEVINASAESTLTCFPRRSLADTLSEWLS